MRTERWAEKPHIPHPCESSAPHPCKSWARQIWCREGSDAPTATLPRLRAAFSSARAKFPFSLSSCPKDRPLLTMEATFPILFPSKAAHSQHGTHLSFGVDRARDVRHACVTGCHRYTWQKETGASGLRSQHWVSKSGLEVS